MARRRVMDSGFRVQGPAFFQPHLQVVGNVDVGDTGHHGELLVQPSPALGGECVLQHLGEGSGRRRRRRGHG